MEQIDYWLLNDGWEPAFSVVGPTPSVRAYTKGNLRVDIYNLEWRGRALALTNPTVTPQAQPYGPQKYSIPDTETAWLNLKNGFRWMSGGEVV